MVILGGAGSQAGVVIGAIVDRRPARGAARPGRLARALLLASSSLGLVRGAAALRGSSRSLGGTFVFGFALHAIAGAIDDTWTSGSGGAGGGVADFMAHWVVVPVARRRLDRARLVHRADRAGAAR